MTTCVRTQLPFEVRKKSYGGKRTVLALLCFAKPCVVLLRWDCLVLIFYLKWNPQQGWGGETDLRNHGRGWWSCKLGGAVLSVVDEWALSLTDKFPSSCPNHKLAGVRYNPTPFKIPNLWSGDAFQLEINGWHYLYHFTSNIQVPPGRQEPS